VLGGSVKIPFIAPAGISRTTTTVTPTGIPTGSIPVGARTPNCNCPRHHCNPSPLDCCSRPQRPTHPCHGLRFRRSRPFRAPPPSAASPVETPRQAAHPSRVIRCRRWHHRLRRSQARVPSPAQAPNLPAPDPDRNLPVQAHNPDPDRNLPVQAPTSRARTSRARTNRVRTNRVQIRVRVPANRQISSPDHPINDRSTVTRRGRLALRPDSRRGVPATSAGPCGPRMSTIRRRR
jgi:hypothetical protein